jgi:hypothetical protein
VSGGVYMGPHGGPHGHLHVAPPCFRMVHGQAARLWKRPGGFGFCVLSPPSRSGSAELPCAGAPSQGPGASPQGLCVLCGRWCGRCAALPSSTGLGQFERGSYPCGACVPRSVLRNPPCNHLAGQPPLRPTTQPPQDFNRQILAEQNAEYEASLAADREREARPENVV